MPRMYLRTFSYTTVFERNSLNKEGVKIQDCLNKINRSQIIGSKVLKKINNRWTTESKSVFNGWLNSWQNVAYNEHTISTIRLLQL